MTALFIVVDAYGVQHVAATARPLTRAISAQRCAPTTTRVGLPLGERHGCTACTFVVGGLVTDTGICKPFRGSCRWTERRSKLPRLWSATDGCGFPAECSFPVSVDCATHACGLVHP